MEIVNVSFCTTDWTQVNPTVHPGETGTALWRTFQEGNIRVRLVEYSPGYQADHWCNKGHVLFVLDGELTTELGDGRIIRLSAGCSYQVADETQPHRSRTETGAKLFIVD